MTAPANDTVPPPATDLIKVTVDGRPVSVPRLMPDWRGRLVPTTMLQACDAAGVAVPHYCYHPKLAVAGNCRMCLVEYGVPAVGPDRAPLKHPDGSLVITKSQRPAIACATPISPGMEIYTSTQAVRLMREGVLEFLLANHPLDCPICDQAGECKLQEYSVEYGRPASRFVETKVHKAKQVDLGPRVMLDQERCILCSRCVRFTRDIVHDDALGIVNRGAYSAIAAYPGRAFANNYTLNTVDLCPVGALTSKDFRFQMRVWFLKETKSICSSCGTGCNIVVGSRENRVYRFTPRRNDAVNSCWMCDAGRLNYRWIERQDRLTAPAGTRLSSQDWQTALAAVAEVLMHTTPGHVAIVASARLSNEELYLIRMLAQHLGALTDCVPRPGEADGLLVCADRNPNTTGARLMGLSATPIGANIPRLAAAIREGAIRVLLVFGEDITKYGLGRDVLAKLETLVSSDIHASDTTSLAHFVLPGCAPVEKRGTFTNVNGRVQRLEQAVAPPYQSRAEWEWLADLLARTTGRQPPETIQGLFDRMTRDVPAFHAVTWAALGEEGVSIQI